MVYSTVRASDPSTHGTASSQHTLAFQPEPTAAAVSVKVFDSVSVHIAVLTDNGRSAVKLYLVSPAMGEQPPPDAAAEAGAAATDGEGPSPKKRRVGA